jgi:hypothetical protein
MGIIRDSFIVFKNFVDAINALPDEYQLETYKALMNYGLNGDIPQNLSPVANAMLISFSKGMETSVARYVASVENGKKGGRPPKAEKVDNLNEPSQDLQEPSETQENLEKPRYNLDKPSHNLNDNVNDNVNVNVNVNEKETNENVSVINIGEQVAVSSVKRFIKPTLEEITAYCNERKNNISPQQFMDFYESKGWKVGNQPMKDWKACIRTWEQRYKSENKSTKVADASKYRREE